MMWFTQAFVSGVDGIVLKVQPFTVPCNDRPPTRQPEDEILPIGIKEHLQLWASQQISLPSRPEIIIHPGR